jgi:hypothetical protein
MAFIRGSAVSVNNIQLYGLFLSVSPNKACNGRLGLGALLGVVSELWRFSVFEPYSRQQPVTQAVSWLLKEDK